VNEDPMTWTEADLRWLIDNKVEESAHLDYKQIESLENTAGKKKELSKDVSAFANSGGGTIVYGIGEDPNDKRLPAGLKGVDPRVTSKEWLEQVIRSNIEYRIEGLGINPVQLVDGNVAYVVVIPRSLRGPHMANDNRYYKRFNFESLAMEHYEVEDVRRREGAPRLTVQPHLGSGAREQRNAPPVLRTRLLVSIKNASPMPAMYALVEVLFDMRIQVEDAEGWKSGTLFVLDDGLNLHARTYNWSVTRDLPVWDGETLSVGPHLEIRLPLWDGDGEFDLKLRVSAPGMPREETSYKIRVLNGAARLIGLDGAEVHDCVGG
jgi:hypothetical protein